MASTISEASTTYPSSTFGAMGAVPMTASPTVRISHPPIAGISLTYELGLPIRFTPMSTVPWSGSREIDAPITVRHVVADDDVSRFDETLDTRPWQTFYRDEAGQTAVRFHHINDRIPPATLRTIREGELYELRYASAPEGVVDNRGRDQLIVTMALPARRRGVMVHSCSIRLPSGQVLLCPGVSGRGKSTLARLVQQSNNGMTLLSDDRSVITEENGGFRVWGTPWPGDANAASGADGPLAAILLIGRSAEPRMAPATPSEMAHLLLETVVLPLWKHELLESTLEMVNRLTGSTPGYFFDYPTVPASADWLLQQFRDVVT